MKTMSDFKHVFLTRMHMKYNNCDVLHFIFDVYIEKSLKNKPRHTYCGAIQAE